MARRFEESSHIDEWELLIDQHQISTRAAGKSSCAWFAHSFPQIDEAISRLKIIRLVLRTVNMELLVCPDGLLDHGDGPASYTPHNGPHYIPEKGFCAVILVDAQNLTRNNHKPWELK